MFFSKKKKPEIRVKTRREKAFDYIKKLFFWLVGAFIVAVALEMFLLPNKIIDGGVIGISMMVSYVTKWNLGLLIFCINIPFMLLMPVILFRLLSIILFRYCSLPFRVALI